MVKLKSFYKNQNGFSIIELMVALAILAIFAIGIVSAFSGSFQAMADSKYRTVATNLAQKKLEEVKNSVGILYPYYSKAVDPIDGMEYTTIVVTETKEENLEQVTATVSWYDRKGVQKDVRLVTMVYNLKTYVGENPEVGKIEISADPNSLTCCLPDEVSTISADVFDKDGERMVPSGTPVGFKLISGGSLSKEFGLTDSVGRATTELTVSGYGPAEVQANSGITYSKVLKVSCDPILHDMTIAANPSTVTPFNSNEPGAGGISKITVSVIDSCGNSVSASNTGEVTVTFTTDHGYFDNSPGTKTKDVTTVNGEATIDLYMTKSGETATVTAIVAISEVDQLSKSTSVFCSEYSIELISQYNTIYPVGGNPASSLITATLKQSGGILVEGQNITFHTDFGTLTPVSEITNSDGKASVTLSSQTGGEVATVSATFVVPDSGGKTISAMVKVKITQYKLSISAEPKVVLFNKSSLITITLTDYQDNPLDNYRVDFITTKGTLTNYSAYTQDGGKTETTLSGLQVGETAEVTATIGLISETVSVTCTEFYIELTASPTEIFANGSSTITAILKNYNGTLQGNKKITFTTNYGNFENNSQSIEKMTGNTQSTRGKAAVTIKSLTVGTTATITAISEDGAEATVYVSCSINYPKLEATNTSTSSGTGYRSPYSYSIKLPNGIRKDDLLIIIFFADGTGRNPNLTGWNRLQYSSYSGHSGAVFYKKAESNLENDQTVTWTNSSQFATAHITLRISNWNRYVISSPAYNTNNSPKPPYLEDLPWGASKTMYIAIAGGDYGRTVSSYPLGYGETKSSVVSGSSGCWAAMGTKDSVNPSEDPGTFRISGSDDWSAWTVAIEGK